MTKRRDASISIGIDPSGCGTSGIYIKSMWMYFPKIWKTQIKASYPIEAFEKIISFIEKVKSTFAVSVTLEFVSVELPHKGKEAFREIKMTRELVALLRNHFRSKFKGHLPAHKDKEKVSELIKKHGRAHEHWIHAQAILESHLHEEENQWTCENWRWQEYGIKKSG